MAESTTTTTTTTTPPAVAATKKPKLHGRAFYESIGSPKYIVAPMVDQSEFAWRMLSRSFLPPEQRTSVLAYTPMFHARLFVDSPRYRASHFEATRGGAGDDDVAAATNATAEQPYLDGNPAIDRPLFVQFCANDPDALLAAAQRVAPYCDAVDLNLGCPQGIARKGHYGAFLQEEPELIVKLVRTLHEYLDVPVTAKIRVLDTPEASLMYARKVVAAGASILTVHGRRREQKGHLTGLADWAVLRYLREHLPRDTVLFANGNILQHGDVARCLAATGFDGVMSAEGLLSDPALFVPPPEEADEPLSSETKETPTSSSSSGDYYWPTPDPRREYWRSARNRKRGGWRIDAVMRRYLDILHVYGLGKAAPPARRPLFVAGDATEWLAEADEPLMAPAPAGGEPARKKRKRDAASEPSAATPSTIPKETATSPNFVSVQGHLFHLLRHAVARHHDIRDALARSRKGDMDAYERILAALEKRIARALAAGEDEEGDVESEEEEIVDDPDSSAAAVRRCKRPWWVVQPILRPMPAEALAKGAIQLKKKVVEEMEKDKENKEKAA